MYCKNCREKLKEGWNYCPKCKNILNAETIEMDEEKIIKSKKKELKESIIYIIIFFAGMLGIFISKSAKGIFFIVSLISIVTGLIRCPNSIFIKILFWLYLIGLIFYVIFIFTLISTCINLLV